MNKFKVGDNIKIVNCVVYPWLNNYVGTIIETTDHFKYSYRIQYHNYDFKLAEETVFGDEEIVLIKCPEYLHWINHI